MAEQHPGETDICYGCVLLCVDVGHCGNADNMGPASADVGQALATDQGFFKAQTVVLVRSAVYTNIIGLV